MTVVIQGNDGTTRDYPVIHPGAKGWGTAKCGAPDCEHPDCALGYARDTRRLYLGMLAVMVFIVISLALFIFVFIPWAEEGGPAGLYGPVRIALGLAILINIIGIAYSAGIVKRSRDVVRELEEFSRKGTVNGIPARQVFRDASSGHPSSRGNGEES